VGWRWQYGGAAGGDQGAGDIRRAEADVLLDHQHRTNLFQACEADAGFNAADGGKDVWAYAGRWTALLLDPFGRQAFLADDAQYKVAAGRCTGQGRKQDRSDHGKWEYLHTVYPLPQF